MYAKLIATFVLLFCGFLLAWPFGTFHKKVDWITTRGMLACVAGGIATAIAWVWA